jgi:hypothetical protein
MRHTRPILCGRCGIPAEPIADRGDEAWGACPRCQRDDRREDIVREANEYYAGKAFRAVFSRLKSGSLSAKRPSKGQYRWIAGD